MPNIMSSTPPPASPSPTPQAMIIAHRGASARAPEHTLAAYREAIRAGADFIEPDLVLTRDGVLVARHENSLDDTTNVAELAHFANRRTTKRVDGEARTDWFAEDFTLAELRTLRARERLPELRPQNDARFPAETIPTLAEIIALVRELEGADRAVGIYPETKHPTYFSHEGHHLDGTAIAQSISQMLIDTLKAEDFVDPARVYIQSFEIENLLQLAHRIMPTAGVKLPLVQLLGDLGNAPEPPALAFAHPWDTVYHARAGHDPGEVYGALAAAVGMQRGEALTYASMVSCDALSALGDSYADALGPWLTALLPRETAGPGSPLPRLTGEVHPLLAAAKGLGLAVHAYTLRPEAPFRVLGEHGDVLSAERELAILLTHGVDGVFADDPGPAVLSRRGFADDGGPTTP
ncbi:MAG: glycerophosphodiester phosphodiesterase family protein [Pseudomonadota bacterium]